MTLRSNPAIPKFVRRVSLLFTVAVLGCSSTPQPPAAPQDTRAADAAAVRKADIDWATAAQSLKADDWVAYYSDDAVVLPPGDAEADSKDAIRKAVGEFLALPGISLTWKPTDVEVARSGDLAYSHGTYEMKMKGPKGKPISDHGKYAEIWKKQADGGWKCAVDIWNSDLPTAPAK